MLFLDHYSSLAISFLTPLVKVAKSAKKGALMRFSKEGIQYGVSYFTGDSFFTFTWECQDKHYNQRIGFVEEPSHLRGEVRFFVCPVTGKKCLKVYLGRQSIFTRYAVRHVYSYQCLSRNSRIFANTQDPRRRNGKTKYGGKITRYGKRIGRYWKKQAKINNYIICLFDRQKINIDKKI